MSVAARLAAGAVAAAVLTLGLWLWHEQGASVWLDSAISFCL